jgi:predicted phosphodiesterase
VAKPSVVPIETPFAVISDIQGNLRALEAVLVELERRQVRRLLVAGDHLLGGPTAQPLEVWRRLNLSGPITIELARSLADTALATLPESRLVARGDGDEATRQAFLDTRKAVGALVLKSIEKLPTVLRVAMADGREVVVVHGAPRDPGVEITHDIDDDELGQLLGGEVADIVIVGGAHTPFQRELGGMRVVGLGSVGQPLGGELAAHVVLVTPRYEGTVIEDAFVPFGA